MRENKKIWLKPVIYIYLIIMTALVSYFASNLWDRQLWPNEKFTVVIISIVSFIILLTVLSIKLNDIFKVFVIYHGAVIFTVLFMLLSYEYRPLMVIFMIITYFAGFDAGLTSCISISVAVSFLYGAEQEYLYGTLIIGTVSCFVAYYVKDKVKFIASTVVFILVSFFVNSIFQYYNRDVFDYGFGLLALAATVISMILFINVYLFTRPGSAEKYIKEDSDFIKEMKEASLPLYYHSIEVAELASAGAAVISCDKRLVYAGGILHDIGKMTKSADYVKSGLITANSYGMPREIKAIIVEHGGKYRIPASKESALIMLADSVISSMEYLKSSEKEVSEKKVIDNVFRIRQNSGTLNKSGLNVKELCDIKSAFYEFYHISLK